MPAKLKQVTNPSGSRSVENAHIVCSIHSLGGSLEGGDGEVDLADLEAGEIKHIEIKVDSGEITQFFGLELVIPLRQLVEPIIRQAIGANLRRREVRHADHRDLRQTELFGRLPTAMAGDDDIRLIDDDRHEEADTGDD